MRRKHIVLSALVALVAWAPVTLADQVNFSFNGGGISSSGTLTVSQTSTPGYDAITGISGMFADTNDGISGAITGLYQPVSYVAPPVATPAFTTSGFSYDDMFYPGGNSPNNCPDYPFFGGVFDVYGVAFDITGGNVGVLWSDGDMPGAGLIYAAGDGNATTVLDNPNAGGADPALPTGVPVSLVTSSTPEPASLSLFGIGLFGMVAVLARKNKRVPA
ncbi:MAG: PEP-CTERM sorting domain-containing protein [Acidobacteriota bacterium]|nr:PEP-CTERM sorting domain-containing protein [Acidobacteriota bacterium]